MYFIFETNVEFRIIFTGHKIVLFLLLFSVMLCLQAVQEEAVGVGLASGCSLTALEVKTEEAVFILSLLPQAPKPSIF